MKKIILITGTSSGFGYYTAKTLARHGDHVYASMRDTTTKNSKVFDEFSATENITPIELDVTSEVSVREAISLILEREGRVDVLVNNAGVGAVSLFEQFTFEEAWHQMNTNFWGPVRCIKEVLPIMRSQKQGLIINIASSLGRFAMPFFSYYCASKHAIEAISESLRAELAMVNVDIAVVEPGVFPGTSFNGNTKKNFPADTKIAEAYGELAMNYPSAMMNLLDEMAKDPEIESPQKVADTIDEIIHTPSSQLKFRYVVDKAMKTQLEDYNGEASQLHRNALTVLGLPSLLRYDHPQPQLL
jgi:NAD(P)-dependent dehydrogenase (short-subunit alcohol dehydrogenase family)